MDLDEDNEQNRKDFNNTKIPLYLGQQNLTLRNAKNYASLLPECRSAYLRTAAVSTVSKLLLTGLKSWVTRSTCASNTK